MNAFWAIVRNESIQLYRDRWYLFLLTMGGMASLVIMAFTLSADIKQVDTLVVDLDRSRNSRQFIQTVINDDFFAVNFAATPDEAEQQLQTGQTKVVLIIPVDYSLKLQRGKPAQIQALIDGSIPSIAELARNHINVLTQNHAQALIVAAAPNGNLTPAPINFHLRIRYNTGLKTIVSVMPGLMSVVLSVAAVGAAAAFGRERERGTLEQLMVSPTRPSELIAGKLAPIIFIAYAELAAMLFIITRLFHIPIRGSLALYVGLMPVYMLAEMGVGMLISTISRNQAQALPSIFLLVTVYGILAGFMTPVDTMPRAAQWASNLIPLKYFINITHELFAKGAGLETLVPQLIPLMVMSAILFTASILLLRRRLV